MDSATFSGNFGYISTSPPGVIWDPLYTVDLTNPYKPTISEGLVTDGINQYLKAITGTQFAIGIGQDSPPGGSAQQTGIKIELYDMKPGTGEMPESKSKFSIHGTATFAEVLWNPRALLYMFDETTKQGIVGFAAESATWSSGHTIFAQGFYLFSFDAVNGSMQFLGSQRTSYNATILLPTFSNFCIQQNLWPVPNDASLTWQQRWALQLEMYPRYVSRAIVNNGYIYTVSDSVITGYCLQTLTMVSEFIGT
jgi:hypothetical protein